MASSSRPFVVGAMLSLAGFSAAQLCSSGVGGILDLSAGAHTINTATGDIDAVLSPGFDGTRFHFTDITIRAGATVMVTGNQALVLLASGDVLIDGTISANGEDGSCTLICSTSCPGIPGAPGGRGGPGGGDGGSGGPICTNGLPGLGTGGGTGGQFDFVCAGGSGAGGGGHSSAGAAGNSSCGVTPAAGGVMYDGVALGEGGSGGGGGTGDLGFLGAPGPGGGGGGGHVIIAALLTVTVSATGIIECRGGDGGADDFSMGCCMSCAGPGGGGSGGTIELEASLLPVSSGILDVAGGAPGANPCGCGEFGGGGAAGITNIAVLSCVPPPTCTLLSPTGVQAADVTIDMDTASPSSMAVDTSFDFSLDGGMTFALCAASGVSPLVNPATGVPTGMATFLWDSLGDGVATMMPAAGVLIRLSIDDGVATVPGQCTTAPFDVDNTAACPGNCGDCDLDGTGPDILDALVSAQIAAGLVIPTPMQMSCCDVNSSLTLEILDSLAIAQVAAGLPVILVCP